MSVRIINDGEYQIMYCSTTMQAFGPVHSVNEYELESFIEWLPEDPRTYSQADLDSLYNKWKVESEMADETNY